MLTIARLGQRVAWRSLTMPAILARFALFYGTLSAVAITLGWLWIMCLTLLLGAELNLQLEDLSAQPPLGVAPTHTPHPSGNSDAA